jgi:transposase
MLQLSAQTRVFVAVEPADFRRGIDGLAALCRQRLREDPMAGAVFVFRNRRGTSLKLLCYDGQGFWLCQKRFSQGRLSWWPSAQQPSVGLSARELQIVLWNGNPAEAAMAEDWRRVA